MSVCRKLPDGTVQKIAGHTILLDANASEVREGTINIPAYSGEPRYHELQVTFSDPMPDADYAVDWNVEHSAYWAEKEIKVGAKTTTGFKLYITIDGTGESPVGTILHYIAWKPVKLDGYTELQNKINNPDDTPTIDSMNLVTSDGVARAIKNASAVWKGTKAEWNALPLADKKTYDLAALTDAGYILAVNRTDGVATETANLNKIFKGTQEEWDALTTAQKNYYEIAHIEGHDDRTYGAVTDVVKKDDMRAITSNAVFQERDRGILPTGTDIDTMVGPEWVGTWTFSPYLATGHVPYIAGSLIDTNAWYILNVISADNRTIQTLYPLHANYIARRVYVDGWVAASDTPVVGTYYGGWHVEYHNCFDVLINFEGTYGLESYIRMDVAGHPSLWIQRRAGYTTVVPMHTPVSLYTSQQAVSALWRAGISTRRVSWVQWGSSFDWILHSAIIQYNNTTGYIEIIYNDDSGPDSSRKHFLPLDW